MATPVTKDTFQAEVLDSEAPVIVDFWAEWCGPCHAVAPVLDRIAEERPELRLVKVNIDEEQELAWRYGVQSIPTIVLFKGGEPTAAAIGAQPKSMLERNLGLVEAYALRERPALAGRSHSFESRLRQAASSSAVFRNASSSGGGSSPGANQRSSATSSAGLGSPPTMRAVQQTLRVELPSSP